MFATAIAKDAHNKKRSSRRQLSSQSSGGAQKEREVAEIGPNSVGDRARRSLTSARSSLAINNERKPTADDEVKEEVGARANSSADKRTNRERAGQRDRDSSNNIECCGGRAGGRGRGAPLGDATATNSNHNNRGIEFQRVERKKGGTVGRAHARASISE